MCRDMSRGVEMRGDMWRLGEMCGDLLDDCRCAEMSGDLCRCVEM